MPLTVNALRDRESQRIVVVIIAIQKWRGDSGVLSAGVKFHVGGSQQGGQKKERGLLSEDRGAGQSLSEGLQSRVLGV